MSSRTSVTRVRREMRRKKMGRKRKNFVNRKGTTPEIFVSKVEIKLNQNQSQ